MPTRRELESNGQTVLPPEGIRTEKLKSIEICTNNVPREIQLTQYKDGIGIQVRGDPEWAKEKFDELRAEYKGVPGFGIIKEERRRDKFNR